MTSSSPSNSLDLVSLPEDILTSIIILTNKLDWRSSSYTCRTLRDISRPFRFREVDIPSKSALSRFCNLFLADNFIPYAGLVKRMTFHSDHSLSSPIPVVFPSLASLTIHCLKDIRAVFLKSLEKLPSLHHLEINARLIWASESLGRDSSLKLTMLSVTTQHIIENQTIYIPNILLGPTRASISSLTLIQLDGSLIGLTTLVTDPFPIEVESYLALRDLRISGRMFKPDFSRFPTLFPVLSSLHCWLQIDEPLHSGNAGPFKLLEDLQITIEKRITPGGAMEVLRVDDMIFVNAPNLKKLGLCGFSSDSLPRVFANITRAGTNALRLTSVSFEMALWRTNAVIEVEVLVPAFSAMKNLEHLTLLGYGRRDSRNGVEELKWTFPRGFEQRFTSMISGASTRRSMN